MGPWRPGVPFFKDSGAQRELPPGSLRRAEFQGVLDGATGLGLLALVGQNLAQVKCSSASSGLQRTAFRSATTLGPPTQVLERQPQRHVGKAVLGRYGECLPRMFGRFAEKHLGTRPSAARKRTCPSIISTRLR